MVANKPSKKLALQTTHQVCIEILGKKKATFTSNHFIKREIFGGLCAIRTRSRIARPSFQTAYADGGSALDELAHLKKN